MKANIKYMLKNWIAWDKKSLIYFFIRVPALVFSADCNSIHTQSND